MALSRYAAVLLPIAAMCAYLLAWSLGTQPVMGDEAYHFRRAINYFDASLPNCRVTHDPAFPASGPGSVQYYDGPFWHMGLAMIWKAIGQPSLPVAQVYQVFFWGLLVFFTYLAGAAMFGERSGRWSAALVATVPLNLLLGMVFYLEIPLLAFFALAVYCLARQRPVALGVALACAMMVKTQTAVVLVVALLAAGLFKLGDNWPKRLVRTGLVLAAMAVILVPDMLWRTKHFGAPLVFYNKTWNDYPEPICGWLGDLPPLKQSAASLPIFNPFALAKSMGVTGLLMLAAALGAGAWSLIYITRRVTRRRTQGGASPAAAAPNAAVSSAACESAKIGFIGILAFVMVVYIVAVVVATQGGDDIRQIQPLTLPAALIVGGLLARWMPLERTGRAERLARVAAGLIGAAMVCQAAAVPAVVHYRRQLEPGVQEGFDWIKRNVPPDARILYLEENLTTYTGRPIVWAAAGPQFLFSATEDRQMRMLRFLGVAYIAVHPTRRCDSCTADEVPTAYPRDWLKTLPGRPYMERIYPPGELSDTGTATPGPPHAAPIRAHPAVACTEGRFLVYRIDFCKVPPEWLEDGGPSRAGAPSADNH